MGYFVPCSVGYQEAISNRQASRYWKILIDIDDDDILEDVTYYLDSNNVTGGGKRGGTYGEAVSNQYQLTFRNSNQWYIDGDYYSIKEGDLKDVPCAIEAKVGSANEYIRIFTGYTSDLGCKRTVGHNHEDKITIEFHDYAKRASINRKPTPTALVGYKICDPATPETSIFHYLASIMGLSGADLDTGTIAYVKDYLVIDGSKSVWQELQELAAQYLAVLTFRYDGKLRFWSRHQTVPPPETAEWTFSEDNILNSYDSGGTPVNCNKATTQYLTYEVRPEGVIFFDVTNYNTVTQKISIPILPGQYYPGETNEKSKATLRYQDPVTGESYRIGKDIVYPTIGSVGGGYDIECSGGIITIISFNGDTLLLKFISSGYFNAIPSDIGKTVSGGTSGDTGILVDYNNTTREWWVKTDDTFSVIEAITILTGAGSGTTVGAATKTTEQRPDGSEIILKNRTGSTITLEKFQIRGVPVKITGDNTVTHRDPGIENDWEIVEKVIPGKYATSPTQAYETVKWWVDYGTPKRLAYLLETFWIPQIQEGAIVNLVIPSKGVSISCVVDSYSHSSSGSMRNASTKLTLYEHYDFTLEGSPEINLISLADNQVNRNTVIDSEIGDRPTYDQVVNDGWDEGIGVSVPTIPTGILAYSHLRDIVIKWNEQNNLTNPGYYEVKVTDTPGGPYYSLRFDGTNGGLDVLGDETPTYYPGIIHTNIPHAGTTDKPLSRTLYYRVRSVTKTEVFSDWSAEVSATTYPIVQSDVEENAIGNPQILPAAVTTESIDSTDFLTTPYGCIASNCLDEGIGDVAKDNSGSEHTLTKIGCVWSAGRVGQCLYFDGVITDYLIENPFTGFPVDEWSISFWVKTNEAHPNTRAIFSYATSTQANSILLIHDSSSGLSVVINNLTKITTIDYCDNLWHNIIVTWEKTSGSLKIYKDSILSLDTTHATGETLLSTGSVVWGQDQDSVGGGFEAIEAFKGYLDELRIFNKVLSPGEVADMFLMPHHPFGSLLNEWNYATDSVTSQILSNVPGSEAVTSGTVNIKEFLTLNDESLVAYYSADNGSGNILHDHSTNKHDGTLIGSIPDNMWDIGRSGKCIKLNGTDETISIGDISITTNKISISLWVKKTVTGSVETLIRKENAFRLEITTNNKPLFGIYTTVWNTQEIDFVVTDNIWHHIVVAWNGTVLKSYIDGVKQIEVAFNYTMALNSNDIYIGSTTGTASWFNGLIDELRIYERDVTEKEIKFLYSNPAGLMIGMLDASRLQTDVLNTLIANIRQYVSITSSGFTGTTYTGSTPSEGDRRAYLDQDEITFQIYQSSTWVDTIKIGGLTYAINLYRGSINLDELTIANSPKTTTLLTGNAGWYRIGRTVDRNCRLNSSSWAIKATPSGHQIIKFSAGVNFGYDEKSFIKLNESIGYETLVTIPKVRLTVGNVYDVAFVEFYYDGSYNLFVKAWLTSSLGFSMDDPIDKYVSLNLSTTSYVDCIPTDIGKTVIGAISGDTGILYDYDNTSNSAGNKRWDLKSTTGNWNIVENVTITGGAGAGTIVNTSENYSKYEIDVENMLAIRCSTNSFILNRNAVLAELLTDGDISMIADKAIGYGIGTTSEYKIIPRRTALTGLPYTTGMTIETDEQIVFIESDADTKVGLFDLNASNSFWKGHHSLGSGISFTTAPPSTLYLCDTDDTRNKIIVTRQDTHQNQYIAFSSYNAIGRIGVCDTETTSPILIFERSIDGNTWTESARISNSGDLSIGTSASYGRLTLLKNTRYFAIDPDYESTLIGILTNSDTIKYVLNGQITHIMYGDGKFGCKYLSLQGTGTSIRVLSPVVIGGTVDAESASHILTTYSTGMPYTSIMNYSTTSTDRMALRITKSRTETPGSRVACIVDDYLGEIAFMSPNSTGSNYIYGSQIIAKAVGSAGAANQATSLEIYSGTSTAEIRKGLTIAEYGSRARVRICDGDPVSSSGISGYFIVGDPDSLTSQDNIVIDQNSIQAKNGRTTASALYLNKIGGTVIVGGGATPSNFYIITTGTLRPTITLYDNITATANLDIGYIRFTANYDSSQYVYSYLRGIVYTDPVNEKGGIEIFVRVNENLVPAGRFISVSSDLKGFNTGTDIWFYDLGPRLRYSSTAPTSGVFTGLLVTKATDDLMCYNQGGVWNTYNSTVGTGW
jgi:hypothetical protein